MKNCIAIKWEDYNLRSICCNSVTISEFVEGLLNCIDTIIEQVEDCNYSYISECIDKLAIIEEELNSLNAYKMNVPLNDANSEDIVQLLNVYLNKVYDICDEYNIYIGI